MQKKSELEVLFGLLRWPKGGLGYAALLAILSIGGVLSKVFGLAKFVKLGRTAIIRLRKGKDELSRIDLRRRFAAHVVDDLQRLIREARWQDDETYSEIDLEVVRVGRPRRTIRPKEKRRPFKRDQRIGTLLSFLRDSEERLFILHGEPGTGKSMALRHAALELAQRIAQGHADDQPIPLYVSLRDLRRQTPNDVVTQEDVRNYIYESILSRLEQNGARYFAREFDEGLQKGRWLVLLDSFDEIPAVLTSTEADQAVAQYASAISGFFQGFNRVRGAVASRVFHGPETLAGPRLSILSLSWARQRGLVARADLADDVKKLVLLGLSEEPRMQIAARNPLILGLIVTYADAVRRMPKNTHDLFDRAINARLIREERTVVQRYHLGTEDLLSIAERVAYTMATNESVGLVPDVMRLGAALRDLNLGLPELDLRKALEALQFVQLGELRGDRFSFKHRRFGEYFATRLVMANFNEGLISSEGLLTGAQWRETCATLLELQPSSREQLLKAAEPLLHEAAAGLILSVESVDDYVRHLIYTEDVPRYDWPRGSLHVMQLLKSGMGNQSYELTPALQCPINEICRTASISGTNVDRRIAVELIPLPAAESGGVVLDQAFSANSAWLNEAAFQQAASLSPLPPTAARQVRRGLITMSADGRLHKELPLIQAHLSRLSDASKYMHCVWLLRWAPGIQFAVCAVLLTDVLGFMSPGLAGSAIAFGLVAALVTSFYSLRASPFFSWPGSRSRTSQLLAFLPRTLVEGGAVAAGMIAGAVLLTISLVIVAQYPLYASAWILLLCAAFIVTWSPALLLAIRYGKLLSRRWTPILQLAYVPLVMEHGVALVRLIKQRRRELAVVLLLGIVGLTALVAGLGALVALSVRLVGKERTLTVEMILAGTIGVGGYICFPVGVMALDRIRLRKAPTDVGRLSVNAIVDTMSRLIMPSSVATYFGRVRLSTHAAAFHDPLELYTFLNCLMAASDRVRLVQSMPEADGLNKSKICEGIVERLLLRWCESHKARMRLVGRLDAGALDEIGQLLTEIQLPDYDPTDLIYPLGVSLRARQFTDAGNCGYLED